MSKVNIPLSSVGGIPSPAPVAGGTVGSASKPERRVDIDLLPLLFDQIPNVALITLDVAGNIVGWNSGAEVIYGYAKPEMLHTHFSKLYPSSTRDVEPLPALQRAVAAGSFEEEGLRVCRDGKEFWGAVSLIALRNEAGAHCGFALTTRDITTHKHNEDGLRRMVELSSNAIVMVNAKGEIVSVNSQTEKMFGYSPDQLIGQPVEVLVPDRYKKAHPKYRDGFFTAPVIRPMGAGRDLYARRQDGTEFPVEIGLTPFQSVTGPAALASIVDITERKRAEERFRLVVESAPSAMVMINRDGRIVLVNLQTEQLFGYGREELLGQAVEILVPDRYRGPHPAYRTAFFSKPTTRSMGAGRDLYGRRKDGSEFPVEIGLNPIDAGDETLVLSAIVDITARKEAEQRTRKHLADLAHVARLSTVGQMFSELAHEINQPLAAAANYARACVSFARSGSGASKEELIEWMEKTVAQTTRAGDIVKRLGTFVKKDGGARSPANINRLIEQVVSLSVPAMHTTTDESEPVELELKLDETAPELYIDFVQIEQVLLNLVRNAIEAMQESAAARVLTLETAHDAEFVYVAVGDTGPGISAEHLTRLFAPYFTTKSSGMGLGLSISRSIVVDHDGQMNVSASEHGTIFKFKLPIGKPDITT